MTFFLWCIFIYSGLLFFSAIVLSLLYWYEATNSPCPQIPPPEYTVGNVLQTIFRFFYSHFIRPAITLAWFINRPKQTKNSPYPPVILIHGIFSTRTSWFKMHKNLVARNFYVESFGYGTLWGSMENTINHFEKFVAQVRKETNSPKVVIVAHSLGGIIIRYWLAKHPHNYNHVAGFITFCTPHKGSNISTLLPNPFSQALNPSSDIINSIATQNYDKFPCTAFVTNVDLLVTPADRLVPPANWKLCIVPNIDHLEILSSKKVIKDTVRCIQGFFPENTPFTRHASGFSPVQDT